MALLPTRIPVIKSSTIGTGNSVSFSYSNYMGGLDVKNAGPATVFVALGSSVSSVPANGQFTLVEGGSWNKENLAFDSVSVYSSDRDGGTSALVELVALQRSGDSSD